MSFSGKNGSSELQDFKAQTVYHSGGSEKEAAAVKE